MGVTASAQTFRCFQYSVSLGGSQNSNSLPQLGNILFGSYQGLSGNTMGQLASWTNNGAITPQIPTNTSSTVLNNALGGIGAALGQTAGNTDYIFSAYQVPAVAANASPRRLAVSGVWLEGSNFGAAVATTDTVIAFFLFFGNTTVSLATTEAANAKAPRRIPLGFQGWAVGAGVGAPSREGRIYVKFDNPIVVNPAEWIGIGGRYISGTVSASQATLLLVGFDYGWI